MKFSALCGVAILVLSGLFSSDISAVGLQEYLQNTDTESITALSTTPVTPEAAVSTQGNQLTNIIELVVAGIVASALIISVLVLFLGRWLAGKEKKVIKEMRIEAEEDKDNIVSAATTIREQEKESTQIIHKLRDQATEFSVQKKVSDEYNQEIMAVAENIKKKDQELSAVADHVDERMQEIQAYWNDQLRETVATIAHVQKGLDQNLDIVDTRLAKLNEQQQISEGLVQDFLEKHDRQKASLKNTSKLSDKITQNLETLYEESSRLIKLLKKHEKDAEKSLKNYANKLNSFEEQAYEQFDTSFQVADLARQELTANIDESRKHIETMRRQEEQSHGLSAQTMKNLEALDYSKIVKISNTLDSTQDTFDDIHNKIETTRHMLEELKEIESTIKETATNTETEKVDEIPDSDLVEKEVTEQLTTKIQKESTIETTEQPKSEETLDLEELDDIEEDTSFHISDYKIASGDNTPLSFFRNIKQKEK